MKLRFNQENKGRQGRLERFAFEIPKPIEHGNYKDFACREDTRKRSSVKIIRWNLLKTFIFIPIQY